MAALSASRRSVAARAACRVAACASVSIVAAPSPDRRQIAGISVNGSAGPAARSNVAGAGTLSVATRRADAVSWPAILEDAILEDAILWPAVLGDAPFEAATGPGTAFDAVVFDVVFDALGAVPDVAIGLAAVLKTSVFGALVFFIGAGVGLPAARFDRPAFGFAVFPSAGLGVRAGVDVDGNWDLDLDPVVTVAFVPTLAPTLALAALAFGVADFEAFVGRSTALVDGVAALGTATVAFDVAANGVGAGAGVTAFTAFSTALAAGWERTPSDADLVADSGADLDAALEGVIDLAGPMLGASGPAFRAGADVSIPIRGAVFDAVSLEPTAFERARLGPAGFMARVGDLSAIMRSPRLALDRRARLRERLAYVNLFAAPQQERIAAQHFDDAATRGRVADL